MQARVVYEQILSGLVSLHNNPRYQGHHFYSVWVNSLLDAQKTMENVAFNPATVTQVFDIDNYTDILTREVPVN